jgi:GH15 family glucan-1,4-alpha-glucosidase
LVVLATGITGSAGLRDATLTLLAFMNAGYYDEARCWRDWLLRAAAGSPSQIQTMYGSPVRLTEWEVPWLSGYEGSKPVRIGNAASDQLQIDVFGEVMDALHLARVGGPQDLAEGWDFQHALLSHLEKVWSAADDGIWEVRGERRHFTPLEGGGMGRIRPGDQERGGLPP